MSSGRIRILLLSVGSLAAQNAIDALGRRRARVFLCGANSVAEAAGNFRCDVACLLPPASAGEEYIQAIAALIERERPDIVIPGRDDDTVALAGLRERRSSSSPALIVGSLAAAQIMNDKLLSASFASRHGLPFAPTVATAQAAAELAVKYDYPLIGKPRSGNGSRGVVLLRSEQETEHAFAAHPDLVAQPFLDPPPGLADLIAPPQTGLPFFYSLPETSQYNLQIIIGPDGDFSAPFGCINVMVGGQSVQTRTFPDGELLSLGRDYARAMIREGWIGPLNIQLKRGREGGFFAIEMNGRLSGGTAARALLGLDEMGEVIHRFLPHATFPKLRYPAGCAMVQKSNSSHPVLVEGAAALQSAGRWVSAQQL